MPLPLSPISLTSPWLADLKNARLNRWPKYSAGLELDGCYWIASWNWKLSLRKFSLERHPDPANIPELITTVRCWRLHNWPSAARASAGTIERYIARNQPRMSMCLMFEAVYNSDSLYFQTPDKT